MHQVSQEATSQVMPVAAFTFCEETHTYTAADGIVIPSVTQLLKSEGFINFDGIPFSVLERKRRLGSLVHQATELWDRGEDLNQFEIPEAAWSYIQGYFNFVEDTKFQPVVIEERRLAVVRGMRYGMTPDRRGDLNGIPHVIELKCGASSHPAWGLQLAAYDLGAHQKQQEARAALQLGPQFARGYKLHPYEESSDYNVWISALAQDVWKRNHKISQYEDVPERLY